MSQQAIPTPLSCSTSCVPSGTASVPGPQGPAGAAGADGTDGISPFTTSVDGTDVMPAEGGTVDVVVATDTSWAVVGEPVYVQFWGTLIVTAVTGDPKVLQLQNPEDSVLGTYAGNAAPGTVLPAGSRISPSGFQGPSGTVDASLYMQKANNLSDVDDVATSRSNLGLGTVATFDQGTADGQIPRIDDAGGLNLNYPLFSTNNGIKAETPAVGRGLLGLGTVSTKDSGTADNEVPQVDDAAGLTDGEAIFATATGIESVDAATARSRLGVTSGGTAMLLYAHISNTNGGAFNSGSRQTVPLNTEVVDTGGNGSISGSQVTLAAGTYRYRFGVIGNEVNYFVAYLYNVTAAAIISNATSAIPTYGTPAYNNNGGTGPWNSTLSLGQGRFTIAVSTVIELSAECQTTKASDGFGRAGGFTPSGNYYYSWLELEKE